jgi:hypothetical protein
MRVSTIVDFHVVLKIPTKFEKWQLINQLLITCWNLAWLIFVVGIFLNVYTH